MGLFTKKEKVPEIPSAPSLPELPSPNSNKNNSPDKNESPGLPSFSNTNSNDNLNQEIVKSAVSDNSDSSEDHEVKVDELPRNIHSNQDESQIPSVPNNTQTQESLGRKRTQELDENTPRQQPNQKAIIQAPQNKTKEKEPIFVRIDKFQDSQKIFEDIKKKTDELEEVVEKLKNTKEKEEKEINSWERDLKKLKEKLSDIDSNIFDQV